MFILSRAIIFFFYFKHQSPQSFAQSITELMSTLQRSSDHSGLLKLQPQLEFLSNIDPGAGRFLKKENIVQVVFKT